MPTITRRKQTATPNSRPQLLSELRDAILSDPKLISTLLQAVITKVADIKEGMEGEQGPKGLEGMRGAPGPKGTDGKRGLPGIQGPNGDKGDRGLQGDPGPQGLLGPQGIAGSVGKDGSPDTPEQIASKLNKLDQAISINVIKGLNRAISQRAAPARGGGMGNWLHEHFATSSATTAVTTASRAAASGTAHMLRYNGQLLAYGRQYTLSGKTYTFTFTLDDDSDVDITYVRTA